ncbi:cache domain-containing protein [Oceanospirillum sediminis]|uniref:Sensory/regulatory protein RpfC n=1 Tax=Oceanospirillum sediminis TaxID=2760088 RepID=A0A839IQD1_9GAMM|nr:cache domain-containing protein [Oceanospirillum sediminis]MBB1486732.1 cache domain-containing protein [Oceanospirillum sediminis]
MAARTLSQTVIRNTVMISTLCVGLVVFLWFNEKYTVFSKQIGRIQENYLNEQKDLLKREVEKAEDFIFYMKSSTEQRLKDRLKEQIINIHSIITDTLNNAPDSISESERIDLIKQTIRSFNYNKGKGYVFAVSMDGIIQAHGLTPHLEGRSGFSLRTPDGRVIVQEAITIMRQADEGYQFYNWLKPDESGDLFPKIAYIKSLSELGWYIGTGEYLDEFTSSIQSEIVSRLAKVRFGNNGSLFLNTYMGRAILSQGNIMIQPDTSWGKTSSADTSAPPATGQDDNEYIFHAWKETSTGMMPTRISYIKKLSDWQWVLGASAELDKIDLLLAQKKDSFREELLLQSLISLVILLIGLAMSWILSRQLFLNMQSGIERLERFFEEAKTAPVEIDSRGLEYQELEVLANAANDMNRDRAKMYSAEVALRSVRDELEFKVQQRTAELEESKDRLNQFQDISSEAVIIHHDQRILDANPAAERLFGYSTEELRLMTLGQLIPQVSLSPASERNQHLSEIMLKRKNGSRFWGGVTHHIISSHNKHIQIHRISDISARKEYENLLRVLAEGISYETGQDFFEKLVTVLAEYLNTEYVIAGKLRSRSGRQIQSLAIASHGHLAHNICYELNHTPSEQVITSGTTIFEKDVGKIFPADETLKTFDASGYVGIPLRSSEGKPIGILIAMSSSPVSDPSRIVSLMKIFAVRAATEIERLQAQKTLARQEKALQEQSLIRNSEKRLKNILESSPVGVGLSRISDGVIIYSNEQCARLLGYSQDDWKGKTSSESWVNPEDQQEFLEEFNKNGRVSTRSAELKRKDGSHLWCLITIEKMTWQDEECILYWIVDISHQKENEEALQKARDEAIQATQAKSGFLANMSHEIRTPLNAITGFAHLTLRTSLTPQQADYLKKIERASDSLLGVINDILDFSKIEAGYLQIEETEFSLEDVLEHLSDLIRIRAEEKGLEIFIMYGPEVPDQLVGDPLRLGQILLNIASNAVKFTEKGEITLLIESQKVGGSRYQLRFSVSDTGIGMSQLVIDKLFQPFSQADSTTTRRFGGTGLGLAITRQLIEMMKGRIEVKSQVNAGTQFFITLPFKSPESQPGYIKEVSQLAGKRVLIADDNSTSRHMLSAVAESYQMRIDTAETGLEAYEKVKQACSANDAYDLVLMDWIMPGMDGITSSQNISQLAPTSPLPSIIMVTGRGKHELEEQASLDSFSAVLVKPVSPSLLRRSMLKALDPNFSPGREGGSETILMDTAELDGINILLVEDNKINQQIARELLEQQGVNVTVADNGLDAVHLVETRMFRIVLMDIQMPVLDGYHATEKIRERLTPRELPVIAMTAHALNAEKEHCLRVGMNDHIAKPINPTHLYQTLLRWLKPETPLPENSGFIPFMDFDTEKDVPDTLDTASGVARVAGNKKIYRKLLTEFIATYSDCLSDLSEYYQSDDKKAGTSLAHTVKGAAANLGAMAVSEAAARYEMCLKENEDPQDAGVVLGLRMKALQEEVIRFNRNTPARAISDLSEYNTGSIETAIQQATSSVTAHSMVCRLETAEQEKIARCLLELKRFITDGSFQAAQKASELKELMPESFADKVGNVQSLLDEFEFDDAEEALNVLENDFKSEFGDS